MSLLVSIIYLSFCCRYIDVADTLDMCTFLDPRVKSMPYLPREERQIIHDMVIDKCMKDAQTSVTSVTDSAATSTSQTASNNALSGLLCDMFHSDNAIVIPESQSDIRDVIALELKQYLAVTLESMDKCPLAW